MIFAQEHVEILAALRAISFPTYVDLMQRCHDDASTKSAMTVVRNHSDGLNRDEGSVDLPDLTQVLGSTDYREFLAHVSERAPEHVPVVQHVLETREYEERLARTKAASLVEYLD